MWRGAAGGSRAQDRRVTFCYILTRMKAKKNPGGRPSIYSPKDDPLPPPRISKLTKEGRRLFEQARKTLGKLVGWKGAVSDADVVEFLARERQQP